MLLADHLERRLKHIRRPIVRVHLGWAPYEDVYMWYESFRGDDVRIHRGHVGGLPSDMWQNYAPEFVYVCMSPCLQSNCEDLVLLMVFNDVVLARCKSNEALKNVQDWYEGRRSAVNPGALTNNGGI